MAPEHLGRPPSQGRIDVNRYARQPARIDQAGNIEQQLLRALEREYRNDEVPARRDGLPDLPLEQCTALPDGVLLARLVAIGALANNMVGARGSGRIWMERLVLGAKIPREEQTQSADNRSDERRVGNECVSTCRSRV